MKGIHSAQALLDSAKQRRFPDTTKRENADSEASLNDGFIPCDYAIRSALARDIDLLMAIEADCWPTELRTERAEIEQRLTDPACYTFVVEHRGKVIGVNYAQRISAASVMHMSADALAGYRDRHASCIQLIALNIASDCRHGGWGEALLEFVLQYFSLLPDIDEVYAITRCRDFLRSGCAELRDYLRKINRDGIFDDPILMLHQRRGAAVFGIVEGYRPADKANQGCGIVVRYDIHRRQWGGDGVAIRPQPDDGGDIRTLLTAWLDKFGAPPPDEHKTLAELGLDSLDLSEVLTLIRDRTRRSLAISDLVQRPLGELFPTPENQPGTPDNNAPSFKQRLDTVLRRWPEMVPLAIEGEGPCTFWFHPISGDVGIYNRIAGCADRSFRMVAFKAHGFLMPQLTPFDSLETMADYYCRAMIDAMPDGPYHLAGFSFGGTLAYEVARQLQLQGKNVETLLLVESPCVEDTNADLFVTDFRSNMLVNASFLMLTLLSTSNEFRALTEQGDIDWRRYTILPEQVAHIADEALADHLADYCRTQGLRHPKAQLIGRLQSMTATHLANLHALRHYRAKPLPKPGAVRAWMFRTHSAQATSEIFANPDYLLNVQQALGSLEPLLRPWQPLLPGLQTWNIKGNNHIDVLRSPEDTQAFYLRCKQAYLSPAPTEKAERLPVPVAVIGMAGRFPDAQNIDQYWQNLASGHCSVRQIAAERGWCIDDYYHPEPKTPGKTYACQAGLLQDIDLFDPLFFRLSPREAAFIDPSERLFLQEAWRAIENAGYSAAQIGGRPWGVFCCAQGDYALNIQRDDETFYLPTHSYSSARLSYLLNLTGPAVSMDTACSSTLAAVASACDSLTLGNCEAAVAGGGAVYVTPNIFISSSQSLLLSPDGQCRTFDREANGTVVGEAIGAVVLKLLPKAQEDKDTIYAVIRGWGMNQDGKTNGITAPSGESQKRLYNNVYRRFSINPAHISLIEAHGTGTRLGDDIELQALTETFAQVGGASQRCVLGSVKPNIGHAYFGAGIASLIKVLLALRAGQIPPNLNFHSPNPRLTASSPFFVTEKLMPWQSQDGHPRCAAINAFGATGTNVHLVVEEYPQLPEPAVQSAPVLVVLSAKSAQCLSERVQDLLTVLERGDYGDEDLGAIAFTLQTGRDAMVQRLALKAATIDELRQKLSHCLTNDIEPCQAGGIWRSNASGAGSTATEATKIEAMDDDRLMRFWVDGGDIDWQRRYAGDTPFRVPLPGYPFARERCWFRPETVSLPEGNTGEAPPLAYQSVIFSENWERAAGPAARNAASGGTILCFLSSPCNQEAFATLGATCTSQARLIFVQRDSAFHHPKPHLYGINPDDRRDFQRLLAETGAPSTLLYLWPCEEADAIRDYGCIVRLLQTLESAAVRDCRLVLGASCHTESERRYAESWMGFERSIGPLLMESRPHIFIHHQERGDERANIEECLRQLWQEIAAGLPATAVLYRKRQRHLCHIGSIQPSAGESLIRQTGTYLITGGLGGVGYQLADYLSGRYRANLILTGRSPQDAVLSEKVARIAAKGGQVCYIQADICDQAAMRKALAKASQRFGDIHGVIHAAGVHETGSLFSRHEADFARVIAPKIAGAQVLDDILRDIPPDFICYFSSLSAILGDFGSCDYAVANRFLGACAEWHQGPEKRVAIHWPLWREGGMTAEDVRHTEAYLATSGQRLLESDEGMALFEAALKHQGRGFGVMVGLPARVEALLHPTPILADGEDIRAKTSAAPLRGDDGEQVKPLCDTLRELAGQVLGMVPDKIGPREHLVEFGFDSIRLVEYARLISEAYAIQLTGASLLGRATIEEIASFLINEHALQHAETGQTADVPITDLPGGRDGGSPDEPIAVIGISGRFPGADTVSLFWDNLLAQRDCISDCPGDRPRWPEGETGRGGYLADISRFDAALFHLSPHDACLMDPRQRLFLQEAWKAFEDAGYMGGSLRGSACGVYVGAEEGEYGYLAGQSGEIGSAQNADLAARVAHFFDLSGPNSAQSASCSSGLVALHSACQALRLKECEMALVGGVNLLLSPLTFTGMASMDLLSPCATTYLFDERANGMVPAEAVVALVLKPLSRALRDGDNIHGCIRASGVNSNGAGPGMMTPNPLRQAALIVDTCTRYRIRLGDLGYLMTHSIGSRFGDAAEIEGLNRAFDTAGIGEARCALGSVKPSIGHTFAASGIVSVIALLMAIKHRTIPGLPNYRHINPDIDLRSGRFILDARSRPWASEPECPRSGAVSSAGNNGTNAFAVIEEYLPGRETAARGQPAPPYIFVFSALTQEQLQESVERVLRFLQQADSYSPAEVAYTLQTGREGLPWRLAVIAATLPQLIARAQEYLQTAPPRQSTQQVWFAGQAEGSPPGIVADQHLLQASPEQIARRWVEGGVIPWHRSYADHAVRRVSLPGYPFAGERYWVMTKKAAPTMSDDADEHDLTGEALSVALEQFARGFFAEKLAIEATRLDINRTFRHYGVNSILLLRFMRACETRFRLTVPARKAVEYPTIASLVNFLALEAPAARQRETPAQYQDRKVLEAIEQYASGQADLETIRCLVQ